MLLIFQSARVLANNTGSGALQLGRCPALSGFGGAALDVGRSGLLQDPGRQVGLGER
jgi:hypothetical protein